MVRFTVPFIRSSMALLGLTALSSAMVGASTESEFTEGVDGLYFSFAEWCSFSYCNLRLFTIISGEILVVDSSSSELFFCELPNPSFATDSSRVFVYDAEGEIRNISQCTRSDSQGWYGDTFIGSVTYGNSESQVVGYSVMKKAVGVTECGPVRRGSIGIAENTVIRGILGLGIQNEFTYSDSIDEETWTQYAVNSGKCIKEECECPPPVANGMLSSFQYFQYTNNITQTSISWDGTLGEKSGVILFGDKLEKELSESIPKIPIDADSRSGLTSMDVTSIALDGVFTSVTSRKYFFETGDPWISVPSESFDNLKDGSILSFYFSAMDSEGANTDYFDVTVTQELIDAKVFRSTEATDRHVFGLNMHRYLKTIILNYNNPEKPYVRLVPRESPILELPKNLPVGKVIKGSDITNSTIGDVGMDSDNVISTTIENMTGATFETAAATIWNNKMTFVNIVLAVSGLTIAFI